MHRVRPRPTPAGARKPEKRARRPPGRPTTPPTQNSNTQSVRPEENNNTQNTDGTLPNGPASLPSSTKCHALQACGVATVGTYVACPQAALGMRNCTHQAAVRCVGAAACGYACRASAVRPRAADAPSNDLYPRGTPGAGGGRRGSLINPNGGERSRDRDGTAVLARSAKDTCRRHPKKQNKKNAAGCDFVVTRRRLINKLLCETRERKAGRVSRDTGFRRSTRPRRQRLALTAPGGIPARGARRRC